MSRSGRLVKCSVLAASSLGALALWRLRGSPLPREDLPLLDSRENRVESFTTEDGIALKLKRYVNEGAQPILFAHGFFGNGLEFDLPHREHNLALYLAEQGYDVWISSFRGCGKEPYRCDTGDWRHSVDHLAALDAPALVKGVSEATGRKPIWIGHSMGGIVLYMYLLGAKLVGDDGGFRVSTDPELARERNTSLLGAVTIGSPPGLHCGGGDWIAKLERLPFYAAATPFIMRYLASLGRINPRIAMSRLRDLVTRFPRLGRVLAKRGPIAMFLYNPDNVDADVGYSLLKSAADNVTTSMAAQIVALAADPDLKDYNGECNYTVDMHTITAPIFFITGTVDFVGADNVREYGYEQVASDPKRFKNYQDYGHTDLVMGKRVYEEVYPEILAWVEELARLEG
ncbi:MAG: alpha/beta fold hydrolase [Actinobacteria bacterium]|jgi:pimeloyl-ACP methyl ester carboxylesterase|nr:MAG: alpha/beta fold hydrolase [Actinomycetota bacterium]